MPKDQILAVGSVALDTVRTPFGQAKEALGGSATFFSASARFFSPVAVIAVVGQDFPKEHLSRLNKLGVDTSGIEVAAGKTFRWEGYYEYELNKAHTVKTELNVFQTFSPKLSEAQKDSKTVFLANIDPDLQQSVLKQMRAPRLTACDTMNFWIESKKKSLEQLLKKVDVFLCNDGEARELTGEHNLIKAAKKVLSKGVKIFVIKKGEHGVVCFTKNSVFVAPAFLLEDVFDPTGAGDTFAGGFIGYLSQCPKVSDAELRQAVLYGSVLASFNVESFSLNRLAALKMSDVRNRAEHFKKLTKF